MLRFAGKTHVGKVRPNNEDSYYIPQRSQPPVVMIADGMGGHNAGEVASSEAIRLIAQSLEENMEELRTEPGSALRKAIYRANLNINALAQDNQAMRGMGTTITAAVLEEKAFTLGHIGDSRAYLYHRGKLHCLTRDQSVVQELVDMGKITRSQAQHHPQKNLITRALGAGYEVEADILENTWQAGDLLLLCSDGLNNFVTDDEMRRILAGCYQKDMDEASLEQLCDRLVTAALSRGGGDNITVVVAYHAKGVWEW